MIKVKTGLRSHLERDLLAACAVVFVLIIAFNIGRHNEPEPQAIQISSITTR